MNHYSINYKNIFLNLIFYNIYVKISKRNSEVFDAKNNYYYLNENWKDIYRKKSFIKAKKKKNLIDSKNMED